MIDVLTVLLNRQIEGRLTTFGKLAIETGMPVRNAVARLQEAVQRGETRIGYWDSWQGTGMVYAYPSPTYKLRTNVDRYVWPELSNELITTDMAARVYVWNTLNPVNMELYKRYSSEWYEMIVPVYEALALARFGKRNKWLMEHGLWDKLPVYTETTVIQPKILKRGSHSRVSGVVCRYCCVTMEEPTEMLRGIHDDCLEELAIRTGRNVKLTMRLAIITNEELDKMLAEIQDLRPLFDADEADTLHPEGYMEIAELLREADDRGVKREKVLWAVGGRYGYAKPYNVNFAQFRIGKANYVSKNAIKDLPLLIDPKI